MTFQEAEKKLSGIAKGKYRSCRFDRTIFSESGGGGYETECVIYIDGESHYSGPTWADAFRAREIAINRPVEEVPNIEV